MEWYIFFSNGQKMSKRLKNYPDPVEIVNKYGADALRWVCPLVLIISFIILTRLYLINSPVVRAESLKFQEPGVRDVVKDVFLPWFNAYRFLIQNVIRLEKVSIKIIHVHIHVLDMYNYTCTCTLYMSCTLYVCICMYVKYCIIGRGCGLFSQWFICSY